MPSILVGNNSFEATRIFGIGRNYVAHARELNNEVPDQPVIFMKPASALIFQDQPIIVPNHGQDLQHEVEVVVLIGHSGRPQTTAEARSFIAGLALGLDLTLRDVQNELKKKGLPWERAKAFDTSAPLGPVRPFTSEIELAHIDLACEVNTTRRQTGSTGQMIFPITTLIAKISEIWQLMPGDLIYTGTPAGVGPLQKGDTIRIFSTLLESAEWEVV